MQTPRSRAATKIGLVAGLLVLLFGFPALNAEDGKRETRAGCACHQNCPGEGLSRGGGGPR